MSKKSATNKTRTTRHTSTPQSIDHRQLALLAYIDDGATATDAIAAARAILRNCANELASGATGEVSIMHGGSLKWPGVFSTVFDRALKEYERAGDWNSHVQFMAEVKAQGDQDLSITDPAVPFDIMVKCITDAAVLGAAMMYELMTERAR